jgi:hypothetical protein
MEKLKGADSAITYCIKSEKLIIIEDWISGAKKDANQSHYVPRDDDLDEHGSLLCYPNLFLPNKESLLFNNYQTRC